MNQNIENVDYEWLIQPTGDPFTDVGGMVLKFFSEKFPNKNIEELIEEMAKIYVNNWSSKLNAFFLNSTITQPAFKGKRKIEETKKFFKQLITQEKEFKEGYCRITGRETQVFQAGRDNHILSGSSGFINFNHALENGLYVSKEVLIRMFFVPFGLVQLSDKIALIQSNNLTVSEHFVIKNCKENFNSIGTGLSEGVLKSEFKNPANALFAFADNCIKDTRIAINDLEDTSHNDISLILYYFTNYADKADISFHSLDAINFTFYRYCISKHSSDWKAFVFNQYRRYDGESIKYNFHTQSYSRVVKEYVQISQKSYDYLKSIKHIYFDLSICGKLQEIEKIYFVLDKGEYEYWKQTSYYKEWKKSTGKNYKIDSKIRKEEFTLNFKKEDYTRKWHNTVYKMLLQNKSLTSIFLSYSLHNKFSFSIVQFYSLNILNMEQRTITKIKEIANFIVNEQENDKVKKSITYLNGNKSSSLLRTFLIGLVADNYKKGNPQTLINLKDYVEYLFPDSANWRETQNLLLIAIYQILHENQISIEIELDQNDLETQND